MEVAGGANFFWTGREHDEVKRKTSIAPFSLPLYTQCGALGVGTHARRAASCYCGPTRGATDAWARVDATYGADTGGGTTASSGSTTTLP
jgi:hypothetical protein